MRASATLRMSGAVAAIAVALVAAWAVSGPQRSATAGQDALALLDRGNVDGARAKVADARDANPLSVEPLFELSVVEQKAGREAAARAALEEAVRLQPDNPKTWLRLSQLELYVLQVGRRWRSTPSARRSTSTRATRRRSTRSCRRRAAADQG